MDFNTGTKDDAEVLSLAREWLRLDKDPETYAEIDGLLSRHDTEELRQRFIPRIAFGTAGLRARAEAGFARMNCLVVAQTSQGLAQHLADTLVNARERGVVIGFDGRKDSRRFGETAASAFAAMGFKIIWYDSPVHTPLVPFGVIEHNAAAGVMITASHNPKDDNGYKVYGANGCQINDPEDKLIAQSILRNTEPLAWKVPALQDQRVHTAAKYYERVAATGALTRIPRFVYTPLHGVGFEYLAGALALITDPASRPASGCGFQFVKEQAQPDASFPTVRFPNPEEQGALDLAKDYADKMGIDLIIANDPDADRLAVAQKISSGWHQYKGDEIGVLLGYYVYQQHQKTAFSQGPLTMLTSAVSSQMLGAIGHAEGFVVEETLTGFKWLGNRALEIGTRAAFAYEEALGYLVPSVGYDKDGVAATILLLQACQSWGSLPHAVLEDLYRKYGYFENVNTYWKSPSLALTKTTFSTILAGPQRICSAISHSAQCRVRDLVHGTDTATANGRSQLPSSEENLMLTLWLSGDDRLCEGVRCTIRASGTEPKLKVYIECQSNQSRNSARDSALLVLGVVRSTFFRDPKLVMESKFEAVTRT